MFNKILVPLDGSELAEQALPPALTIAHKANELILLNAPMVSPALTSLVYTYDVPNLDISIDHLRAQAERYLALQKAELKREGLTIHNEVVPGDAASIIIDTAIAEDVDLIVMSTHGYTGLDHLVMGSVTERVLRQAPCPVLVVRDARPIEHVLITLDGSELAESAIEPGLEMAKRFAADVTLLRAKEPRTQPSYRMINELEGIEPGLGTHMVEDYYSEVDSYLLRQQHRYQEENCEVSTIATIGNPAKVIRDYVTTNDIDLVVIATHGRTGLRRWVYGSVAEKVLRGLDAAVLVIRP